jgi:glycerophosphoryl diester phosphodiesterase family protein
VSGWVTPPSAPVPGPGPLVGWVAPDEPIGLGIGEIIRAGWRLTTANLGRLAAITAVPVFLVQLLLLPFWWGFGQIYERMFTFYTTADWQRYANDPEGLQRDLQAVMQQPNELAALAVIAGGLSFVIGILGAAALASATLDAADGRRPTIGSAYGAVARRIGPIVVPALVLGLGYVVVLAPISMNSGSFASADLGPGRSGLTALLSLAVLILEIAAFYLAIRWAPYFQVVIAEDVGIRTALRRSSEVTHGIRLRLALALVAFSIGVGLVFSVIGLVVGIIVGVLAASFFAGIVGWTVTVALSGLVYFPVLSGALTHVYRLRREVAGHTDPARPGEPAAGTSG